MCIHHQFQSAALYWQDKSLSGLQCQYCILQVKLSLASLSKLLPGVWLLSHANGYRKSQVRAVGSKGGQTTWKERAPLLATDATLTLTLHLPQSVSSCLFPFRVCSLLISFPAFPLASQMFASIDAFILLPPHYLL